jgi:hypothetical protein
VNRTHDLLMTDFTSETLYHYCEIVSLGFLYDLTFVVQDLQPNGRLVVVAC